MRRVLFSCLIVIACALPGHFPDHTAGAAVPAVQATIYSADKCVPCRRYIAAVKKEMPPDGWIVRDAAETDSSSAHVIITKAVTPGIDAFPTTIIRRDGREVDRLVGEITPTQLAQAINKHSAR